MSKTRFDAHLNNMLADRLKKIARSWGGDSTLRKQEAIDLIRSGLESPGEVKAFLDRLEPIEQAALGIAKQFDNNISGEMLLNVLQMYGFSIPQTPRRDENYFIRQLVERGLLMSHNYTQYYYGTGYGMKNAQLFSDDRILAQVDPPTPQPFDLPTDNHAAPAMARQPQIIVLDIIAILRAIQQIDGLNLTKAGTIRVNNMRQLQKTVGWEDDNVKIDGFMFINLPLAIVKSLQQAGVLKLKGGNIILAQSVESFATRPYVEQIKPILKGFVNNAEWQERSDKRASYSYHNYINGRRLLMMALAALPTDTDGFFSMDDFDQAFYDRASQYFFLSQYYRRYEDRREAWLQNERPWLETALSTWLYYLGAVELRVEKGRPVALRLTPLGRTILQPTQAEGIAQPTAEQTEAVWIVQPNFDVVVYLARATPEQLLFIERHAERLQVQQHVAQYRLTRQSVYEGLEQGTELDDLIATLKAGAGVELPQNVLIDLQEWGRLREQMTLHYQTHVLEFPDDAARQEALQAGLKGTPLGDRFVLLQKSKAAKDWVDSTVDYRISLPRCLSVNDNGLIKVKRNYSDMLLETQLAKWAERKSKRIWELTADSVTEGLVGKTKIEELFDFLHERLIVPRLPAFLEIALKSWGNKRLGNVDIAEVIVLHCNHPEVFKAITTSHRLKRYISGTLGPSTLLVDKAKLAPLTEALTWAGLSIGDEINLEH